MRSQQLLAGHIAPPAASRRAHAHRRELAAGRPRARGSLSASACRTAAVSASEPTRRSKGPTAPHSARSRSAGAAVDRLHARLGHELGAVFAHRLDPVTEQHAHGSALVPFAKGSAILEHRVVPRQSPDAPAQAADQRAGALLEHGERIAAKQLAEGAVGRGVRNPPANQATERPRVREAYLEGCAPQLFGADPAGAAVVRPHDRIRQPTVEARGSHIYVLRVPEQGRPHRCG